ncbi:MAG: tyrosinase family protein [Acidimicrobiales bacterium]
MPVVRRNIVSSLAARTSFVDGVLALKADFLGTTTSDVGIPGPAKRVSTYDLFIVWHHLAMARLTPTEQGDRNSAHSGPVFLPWHRLMLLLFELQLQRVLGDPTVGLPYWDWAADGALPAAQQPKAPLWDATKGVGGTGAPVADGPFRSAAFKVEIESDRSNRLRSTRRGLVRSLARDIADLPSSAAVTAALGQASYDGGPWDRSVGGTPGSAPGFRNSVEGWMPSGPGMHNRVHVWVGGDMGPATSPNDPVFYLNHGNVDRIWQAWLNKHGQAYAPPTNESDRLKGHRLTDPLYSLLTKNPVRPADVLDVRGSYSYDSLPGTA